MTSEERHKLRYARRCMKRKKKLEERMNSVGSAEDIFSYKNMYKYGKKCCNGVRWKQSTQNFELHLFSRTAMNRRKAMSGKYKPTRYVHFTLRERGKKRPIDAPHINDRQIHKTLSNECLYPLYKPSMIENNPASIKGKGLAYSQKIIVEDLSNHFRRYGMSGSIILSDMHQFFPTADHDVIKGHHKLIKDTTVRQVADAITDSTPEGQPLGVEPSQFEMIFLPTPMDNYITCQVGIDSYGHYMDDFIIIVPPNIEPNEVLDTFREEAKKLRLNINENKTRIIKFGKPFRFCKAKFIIKPTGRIVMKGSPKTLYRCIRKIKKMKGKTDYESLRCSVNSTLAYYKRYDDHSKVLRLRRTFYALYGFDCEKLEEYRSRDDELYLRKAV